MTIAKSTIKKGSIPINLATESRHTLLPQFSNGNLHILHIGCGGGTGGVLTSNILRLMGGLHPSIKESVFYTGVDGDIFEAKNLGRQMCIPTDLGKNKAAVIVGRYASAFGVSSDKATYIDSYIEKSQDVIELLNTNNIGTMIVIDTVDKNKPRKLIHDGIKRMVEARGLNVYSISCGNGEWTGQVCFGAQGLGTDTYLSTYSQRSGNTILSSPYKFNIPLAFDLMPELIDLESDKKEEEMSCAERAVLNVQTLIANNFAATFALNYVAMLLKGKEYAARTRSGETGLQVPTTSIGLTRYNSIQNSVHQLHFTDAYLRGEI